MPHRDVVVVAGAGKVGFGGGAGGLGDESGPVPDVRAAFAVVLMGWRAGVEREVKKTKNGE
jgi:hypothetical protein